jgi:hypothetical protein
MLPVLKTLMSAAWARSKGPKQIVKPNSIAPLKAILIAFPQRLVWSPDAEITRADEGGKVPTTNFYLNRSPQPFVSISPP